MNTMTPRLLSLACAALLTLTILGGIDQLAQREAAQATQGGLAAAPATRA
jgi:hypothetical protein